MQAYCHGSMCTKNYFIDDPDRTVATMCCSFGGGMIGLAGQYIFFGGKIRVEFVLNCVFGALAAITGKSFLTLSILNFQLFKNTLF